MDRQWLWDRYVQPWVALKESGVGVMVGEWGAYNKTPHDVTLRWMEDCLENFQEAGLGWALWNFRGSFGVLDSGRDDVQYEDFQGRKLDRRMLVLLQRY
jgi:aryl-phospho-beta-D-glucosidase BglC (GH1 family)